MKMPHRIYLYLLPLLVPACFFYLGWAANSPPSAVKITSAVFGLAHISFKYEFTTWNVDNSHIYPLILKTNLESLYAF